MSSRRPPFADSHLLRERVEATTAILQLGAQRRGPLLVLALRVLPGLPERPLQALLARCLRILQLVAQRSVVPQLGLQPATEAAHSRPRQHGGGADVAAAHLEQLERAGVLGFDGGERRGHGMEGWDGAGCVGMRCHVPALRQRAR